MSTIINIADKFHPQIGGVYTLGMVSVRVIQISGDLVTYEHLENPLVTNIRSRGSFTEDNYVRTVR